MKCADEDDLVAVLQHVLDFALELPVAVVDQHQDARSAVPEQEIQPQTSASSFAIQLV